MDRAWRVAVGVAGGPVVDPSTVTPEDLARILRRHRLLGHAGRTDGWTEEQRHTLLPLWRAGQARELAHVDALRRALDALGRSAIRATPLKGIAFQQAMTGQPFGRDHRDLDLWVDPDDVRPTIAVLERLGWRPPAATLANEHSLTDGAGLTLDLHHRLFNDRYALSRVDGLLRSERAADGALSTEGHAFLALLHGAKDGWSTLRHVADAAIALEVLPSGRLDDWARQTRTRGIVALARDLVATLRGGPDVPGNPMVRRFFEHLRGPRTETPTPRGALAYVRSREDVRDRIAALVGIPLQHSVADEDTVGMARIVRRSRRLIRTYGATDTG